MQTVCAGRMRHRWCAHSKPTVRPLCSWKGATDRRQQRCAGGRGACVTVSAGAELPELPVRVSTELDLVRVYLPVQLEGGHLAAERRLQQAGRAGRAAAARQLALQHHALRLRGRREHDVHRALVRAALGRRDQRRVRLRALGRHRVATELVPAKPCSTLLWWCFDSVCACMARHGRALSCTCPTIKK